MGSGIGFAMPAAIIKRSAETNGLKGTKQHQIPCLPMIRGAALVPALRWSKRATSMVFTREDQKILQTSVTQYREQK
ncbi:hypothetical protein JG687_00013535 [Phytophthora cactorum]|uniref:Uncharacterized protein n=1 Tax=Phytophthora cactorum TaxID=29920 RepID=A0A8T1TZ30_9STRA|nr:hypothetical protein JG687_00013535 [Phytophthora cactorum]